MKPFKPIKTVPIETWLQVQLLYETTSVSIHEMARRFDVARATINERAKKGNWTRYKPPEDPEEAARQVSIKAAEEAGLRVLRDGLAEHLRLQKPLSKEPVRQKKRADQEREERMLLRAEELHTKNEAAREELAELERKAAALRETMGVEAIDALLPRRAAAIIPFPGGRPPPQREPEPDPDSKHELRSQIAIMRSMMSLKQLRQIERHETVVQSLMHMLHVYVAPHDFVDVANLSEEEATVQMQWLQRAAKAVLLPTERDTLAGILKALDNSQAVSVQLKRQVAGLTHRHMGRAPGQQVGDKAIAGLLDDEDGQKSPDVLARDVADLRTAELRQVRDAMLLLGGWQQRQDDPPRPPEPDPIDDLASTLPPPDPPSRKR